MTCLTETVRDQIEAEREACIRVLQELRPSNDRQDWTRYAHDIDNVLSRAIQKIDGRYER